MPCGLWAQLEQRAHHQVNPTWAAQVSTLKRGHCNITQGNYRKIRNGFARVITYGDIKNNLPRNLKVSPVA
eukprot:4822394-Ditylum_brightwellii.AAC.1